MKPLFVIGLIATLAGSAAYAQAELPTVETAVAEAQNAPAPIPAPALVGAPEIYQKIPGIKAVGPVGDLEAWAAEGQQIQFMKDPKTGNLIVGFAFDADGKSLNTATSAAADTSLTALLATLFATEIRIPEKYALSVEQRLALLPEAERQAAINALIDVLRDVKDEAAFNAAVEAWMTGLPDAPAGAMPEPKAEAEAEPKADASTPGAAPPAAEISPAVDGAALEPAPLSPDAEKAKADAPTLIEGLRSGAWLSIGDKDAPMVYAVLDPACEPCRGALRLLDEKVSAGDLQIRALLLPAVGDDSLGVIAGIMIEDNPAEALMKLARDEEAVPAFVRPSTMSDTVREGLKTNYDIAVAYKLPQLPFFAFETKDAPEYISGAPAPEQLSAAILSDLDKAPAPAPVTAPDASVQTDPVE